MVTMHGVEFLTIGCELWGAGLGGSGRDGGFCVSSVGACVSLCERRRLRPAHGDSGSWRERAIRSKPVETVHKKPKTAARTNRPQRTTTGPLCPRSDAEGGGGTGTNRERDHCIPTPFQSGQIGSGAPPPHLLPFLVNDSSDDGNPPPVRRSWRLLVVSYRAPRSR